jgi:hypothetical protein
MQSVLQLRTLVQKAGAVVVALCLLLMGVALPALAGINQWTSIGPEGGYIRVIAIDPSTPSRIYAGTDGGVRASMAEATGAKPA